MGGVEHSAECIAQELVDDGPAAEAQQFVGHGEVALHVAPREIDAHSGGLTDAVLMNALWKDSNHTTHSTSIVLLNQSS